MRNKAWIISLMLLGCGQGFSPVEIAETVEPEAPIAEVLDVNVTVDTQIDLECSGTAPKLKPGGGTTTQTIYCTFTVTTGGQ